MHRVREVTNLPPHPFPPLQHSVQQLCPVSRVPCLLSPFVKAGNGNAAGAHSHAHAMRREEALSYSINSNYSWAEGVWPFSAKSLKRVANCLTTSQCILLPLASSPTHATCFQLLSTKSIQSIGLVYFPSNAFTSTFPRISPIHSFTTDTHTDRQTVVHTDNLTHCKWQQLCFGFVSFSW